MSPHAVIAVPTSRTGWRGRYVHSNGHPTATGENIRRIVMRDGAATATRTLLAPDHGWLIVDPLAGRFDVETAGYGTDFYAGDGRTIPGWIDSHTAAPWYITWIYVLTETSIVVHTTDGRRWQQAGHVPYDDPAGMDRIEDEHDMFATATA